MRHANSPSGPGKPTAVDRSRIKEEEGMVELTSKDDAPGGTEGAGSEPPTGAGGERGTGGEGGSADGTSAGTAPRK